VPEVIRLVRDLTRPVAVADWPEGVSHVPFSATLAPEVHALMQRVYANGGGSVAADFDSWWAATRHDAEFDASLCFVAVAAGRPVGFVLSWNSAFLKDVVVDPDWQGKGIGSALLATALRALAERGHAEAALKVHADNVRARHVYEGMGFR
jgi:ribosomal protein S18 acetylase RimI-like enzyme